MVMLIDNNGKKHGVMPLTEALEIAQNQSLDLVQVYPMLIQLYVKF